MMVSTKINGRWDILLPEHRAVRPDWHTAAGWERKRLDSMHAHIKPWDIVYYIGAEEGEMPALCQIWGAQVYMVEPNPKVWPNIKAIWDANKLEKPLGYFVGFAGAETILKPPNLDFEVGDKDGWPLCAYGEVIGNHGFRELYLQADGTPQMKLDDLPYVPTALSIDVEGSEWRVLEGAQRILREHKPKIWLSGHAEFMPYMFNEKLDDLREWIKGFGYTETVLDEQHELHLLYV